MRQISFAHTTDQVVAGTKDVTRRIGWADVKVGELLQGIRKGQGLKKGAHVEKLRVIRVVSARREAITRLVDEPDYGREEMRREGFPGRPARDFVAAYFDLGVGLVTRIEFEYVD